MLANRGGADTYGGADTRGGVTLIAFGAALPVVSAAPRPRREQHIMRGSFSRLANIRMTKPALTHLNESGDAHMVDVTDKTPSDRVAIAEAAVLFDPATLTQIVDQGSPKGDLFAVARVAGIQGAKRCADLIPLCHPLPIGKVVVEFDVEPPNRIRVRCTCRVSGRTGVEMEALTGASIAALTLYDMCKALDKSIVIEAVRLLRKEGGKSGTFVGDERDERDERDGGDGGGDAG